MNRYDSPIFYKKNGLLNLKIMQKLFTEKGLIEIHDIMIKRLIKKNKLLFIDNIRVAVNIHKRYKDIIVLYHSKKFSICINKKNKYYKNILYSFDKLRKSVFKNVKDINKLFLYNLFDVNYVKQNMKKLNISINDLYNIFFFNMYQVFPSYERVLLFKYQVNYKLSKKEQEIIENKSYKKCGTINYYIYAKYRESILSKNKTYLKYKSDLHKFFEYLHKKFVEYFRYLRTNTIASVNEIF